MATETTTPRRPVIPRDLDPTFAGEPDLASDGEPDLGSGADPGSDGGTGDGLQLPEDHPEFEMLRDPEDETLELPAEEQAMHVEQPLSDRTRRG